MPRAQPAQQPRLGPGSVRSRCTPLNATLGTQRKLEYRKPTGAGARPDPRSCSTTAASRICAPTSQSATPTLLDGDLVPSSQQPEASLKEIDNRCVTPRSVVLLQDTPTGLLHPAANGFRSDAAKTTCHTLHVERNPFAPNQALALPAGLTLLRVQADVLASRFGSTGATSSSPPPRSPNASFFSNPQPVPPQERRAVGCTAAGCLTRSAAEAFGASPGFLTAPRCASTRCCCVPTVRASCCGVHGNLLEHGTRATRAKGATTPGHETRLPSRAICRAGRRRLAARGRIPPAPGATTCLQIWVRPATRKTTTQWPRWWPSVAWTSALRTGAVDLDRSRSFAGVRRLQRRRAMENRG